jgi:hypothetical protein
VQNFTHGKAATKWSPVFYVLFSVFSVPVALLVYISRFRILPALDSTDMFAHPVGEQPEPLCVPKESKLLRFIPQPWLLLSGSTAAHLIIPVPSAELQNGPLLQKKAPSKGRRKANVRSN